MKNFVVVLSLSFLISCEKSNSNLKQALEEAGGNRPELEKVLEYFKGDSLKYNAACYLIENSVYHGANYYKGVEEFDSIFKKISEMKRQGYEVWEYQKSAFKRFNYSNVEFRLDNQVLTSEFLITNIESAFYTWKNYPWCKEISFEDFKQQILPYRISTEPLELHSRRNEFMEMYKWVKDSLKDKFNMGEAFTLIYNDFYKKYTSTSAIKYQIPMSYKQVLWAESGLCQDVANLIGIILKSNGVRCAFDYSVQWGNQKNAVHSWISFIQNDTLTYYIDNDKIFRIPQYVHSGKFQINEPGDKYLDRNISVQYYKKGTKIRRNTFSVNPNSIYKTIKNRSEIADGLNDYTSIDVTKHYIKTSNLSLPVKNVCRNKEVVYLTVFGLSNTIVDWSLVRNNIVQFENLGTGVVYFPNEYVNGILKPILSPILLKENGQMKTFIPDTDLKKTLIVKRKYPLLGYTLKNVNFMYGGVFQSANNEDFSDAVDLYRIDSTFIIPTSIPIQSRLRFRYIRLVFKKAPEVSVAELSFYKYENQTKVELNGKIISNDPGLFGNTSHNAFDHDLASYYLCKGQDAWIGLDFGENRKIDEISFCPRSDTNFIIPGNEYELYYWNNGWITLGRKTATDYKITYESVPSGALYWLHCHSGGVEERPFSYENGQQIWW